MVHLLRLLPLLLLAALPLGCAYENNEDDDNDDVLEVRMIFNDRVDPERFFYYLIFNFHPDEEVTPGTDIDVFQDREIIGEFWDIYYLYGRPGTPNAPQPANFYKGFGGNNPDDLDMLRVNPSGTRYIDILPQQPFGSTDLEYLNATITNGPVDPDDPNSLLTGNTIFYRFRVRNFPNVPFRLTPSNVDPDAIAGRAKVTMLVANQGIDNVSNPDDLIDDVIIYDVFREGSVLVNVGPMGKPRWGEQTEPQEDIEETRLPRNPPTQGGAYTGPFKAADLVNWQIELIRQ
ncbi:MAG TPA: hypothetical protein VEI97_09465 [bacterium]|nr:hypothetical protein [bacterium]